MQGSESGLAPLAFCACRRASDSEEGDREPRLGRARRNGITHRLVNIGALDQFLDLNDPNSVIEGRLHYRYARI